MKETKPIGRKAYGSIPHLPNSRMGPADHACHPGQERICCEKLRDRHDRVIVTEKLDGSCMSVAKTEAGEIIALGRAGYPAASSPFDHLRQFNPWVASQAYRFDAMLQPGQRVVGEWLNVATGTRYDLPHEPFVAFDIMIGDRRIPHDDFLSVCAVGGFVTAKVLSDGPSVSIADVLAVLGERGHHGALETVEGAVWRVESRGEFDFIAKFVRHDKIDGKYLPGLHGNTEYTPNAWTAP